MTIEKCRLLLGSDGEHLTDAQLQELIEQLTVIADIALNVVTADCATSSDSVS